MPQPKTAGDLIGLTGALGVRRAGIHQAQSHIVGDGQGRQQIERLEDITDGAIADARQFRIAGGGDLDTFQQIAAGARPIEASQQVHQSRLARAGRPHDGYEFAGMDAEVDAIKGPHFGIADDIPADDPPQCDERGSRR